MKDTLLEASVAMLIRNGIIESSEEELYRFSKAAILVILAAAALVIIFRAPVESQNKPLSAAEQILYQKKSRIILGLETVLVIYFSLTFIELAACIAIAIGCSAFVLVVPEKRDGARERIMR